MNKSSTKFSGDRFSWKYFSTLDGSFERLAGTSYKSTVCNIRLLQSHMRLKKNRPYNHWLKGQGHYLLCFSTSRTVGASSVRLWHETTTRYSLKATTKISPHSRIRNVPILRSLDTQNTWTPLKTGLEQSVKLLFIRQCNFDPFQMDQPKTRLTST